MENFYDELDKQKKLISEERDTYYDVLNIKKNNKIMEYISIFFFFSGFLSLALIPFTNITLIDATCLFIISHVFGPTDGELQAGLLKGLAVDLGLIRANISAFLVVKESEKPNEIK